MSVIGSGNGDWGQGSELVNIHHWLGTVIGAHPSSPELEEERTVRYGILANYLPVPI